MDHKEVFSSGPTWFHSAFRDELKKLGGNHSMAANPFDNLMYYRRSPDYRPKTLEAPRAVTEARELPG